MTTCNTLKLSGFKPAHFSHFISNVVGFIKTIFRGLYLHSVEKKTVHLITTLTSPVPCKLRFLFNQ